MPVNKRSKYRGSRTCGGGTHKNRRGGGSRGGRGFAGGCKHHFVKYLLKGKRYGKDGFFHDQRADMNVMDIGDIDLLVPALLKSGVAVQEGEMISLDAAKIDVDKVLGGGRVTRKLQIKAKAFSEQAKTKIEETGGKALLAER